VTDGFFVELDGGHLACSVVTRVRRSARHDRGGKCGCVRVTAATTLAEAWAGDLLLPARVVDHTARTPSLDITAGGLRLNLVQG